MGVFTQVASNIKGFGRKSAYASCVNGASLRWCDHNRVKAPNSNAWLRSQCSSVGLYCQEHPALKDVTVPRRWPLVFFYLIEGLKDPWVPPQCSHLGPIRNSHRFETARNSKKSFSFPPPCTVQKWLQIQNPVKFKMIFFSVVCVTLHRTREDLFRNHATLNKTNSNIWRLCVPNVEFLRPQGSQSGVSVWQHTLVG